MSGAELMAVGDLLIHEQIVTSDVRFYRETETIKTAEQAYNERAEYDAIIELLYETDEIVYAHSLLANKSQDWRLTRENRNRFMEFLKQKQVKTARFERHGRIIEVKL
ncbi:MAG: hypothetical protein CSB48_02895 [Proteobacteria bacterium]|nr:MAG: hypothetical protein CSB48_02895 [Pseudomonadota bacterium]